jgi:hypothetical protein
MHRVIDELARESHPMLYFRIDHNPANFQTTPDGAASLDKVKKFDEYGNMQIFHTYVDLKVHKILYN